MIEVAGRKFGAERLFLIAGPCLVESESIVVQTAERLTFLAEKFGFPLIFKSSYRKANRLSGKSFSGIGDHEALMILEKVKKDFGLPVLTDIHESHEVESVAQTCDVIQIPAFLCRQTDLLVTAAKSGRAVNIKKGQFLAAEDMAVIAAKASDTGNKNIMLTERGTSFGYRDLVVDYRSLVKMKQSGYPVVFDATHSVQQPGGMGNSSGGQREFVLPLTRAALAVGIDGLFFETHPNPAEAKSDSATQLPLSEVESYLTEVSRIAEIAKKT